MHFDPGDIGNLTFGGFNGAPDYIEKYSFWFSALPDRKFLGGIFIRLYWIIDNSKIINILCDYLQYFDYQSLLAAVTLQLVIIASIICVDFSILLTAIAVKKLLNNNYGILSLILGALLIGISPFSLAPYSDTFSLIFVTIAIYSFVVVKNKYFKSCLIITSSFIGFSIKPTSLAIFVGILTYLIIENLNKQCIKTKLLNVTFGKSKIKYAIYICATAVITLFIIGYISNFGLDINKNREFTYTHFLMIGCNDETTGYGSSNDVDISEKCNSIAEREQANWNTINDRLENLGLFGYIKLLMRKSIHTYDNGSFGVATGPSEIKKNAISDKILFDKTFFKGFYGIDFQDPNKNSYYSPFILIEQVLGITILLLIIFNLFKGKNKPTQTVLLISLILLSGFIMIFEANARYLINFIPAFLILATMGFNDIIKAKFGIK